MNNLGGVTITLKNLFDNYMEFEEIINNQKEGEIDLRKLKCNPTTLLPLLCECKNQNLKLGNGEKAFEYLVNSLKDNELFSKLPESRVESDEVDFITEYMLNINCEYGGYFALRTVISEIAHSSQKTWFKLWKTIHKILISSRRC